MNAASDKMDPSPRPPSPPPAPKVRLEVVLSVQPVPGPNGGVLRIGRKGNPKPQPKVPGVWQPRLSASPSALCCCDYLSARD